MKTYYELLGVGPKAAADQIKRAFRREIARYHPDKVQHLGPEFQEIAATRAAELTEAYRVLMNEGARQRYDEGLTEEQMPVATRPAPAAAPPPAPRAPDSAPAAPFHGPPQDRRFRRERASTSDFVRKAVFAKLRDAVAAVSDGAAVSTVPGIDAVYSLKGKGWPVPQGGAPAAAPREVRGARRCRGHRASVAIGGVDGACGGNGVPAAVRQRPGTGA